MKIVCAASVLHARAAFSAFGDIVILPDRAIRREDLLDATALIVRSKTRVNTALLSGTPVTFVLKLGYFFPESTIAIHPVKAIVLV